VIPRIVDWALRFRWDFKVSSCLSWVRYIFESMPSLGHLCTVFSSQGMNTTLPRRYKPVLDHAMDGRCGRQPVFSLRRVGRHSGVAKATARYTSDPRCRAKPPGLRSPRHLTRQNSEQVCRVRRIVVLSIHTRNTIDRCEPRRRQTSTRFDGVVVLGKCKGGCKGGFKF
jgi:hypothetical protein